MTTDKVIAMPRWSLLRGVFRGFLPLLLAVIGFTLALGLPVQATRQAGAWIRHGFSPALVIMLFVWFYFAGRLEVAILPGALAGSVSFVIGLTLVALWANAFSELQAASGAILFSDAHQYYTDSLRLLNGIPMSAFSARHPLPTVFQAGLLATCGGNLQACLAGMAFLVCLSMVLAAKEVLHRYGALAASVFLLLLFFYSRRFVGFPNSENLGILLGCLGFAWLFRGAIFSSLGQTLLGFFLLTLAMLARPGPAAMLPFIWFCSLSLLKIPMKRALPWLLPGLSVMLAALLINLFIVRFLAESRSQLFSNFAYTLYGITQGGQGWEQFLRDYPMYQNLPAPLVEGLAFKKSWESLVNNPGLAIKGVIFSFSEFFSLSDGSAFGFLAGGKAVSFNQPVPVNKRLFLTLARLSVGILGLLGLYLMWVRRSFPENKLCFFAAVGIILSIPFLPPRDSGMMRTYAAAAPFLVFLPAAGISYFLKSALRKTVSVKNSMRLSGFTVLIIGLFAISLVWILVLSHQESALLPWISCEPGLTPISFHIYPGSFVEIYENKNLPVTHLPRIKIADFQAGLADFHQTGVARSLLEISAGHYIINTINLPHGQPLWVVLPVELFDQEPGGQLIHACGSWHAQLLQAGFGFLIVESIPDID